MIKDHERWFCSGEKQSKSGVYSEGRTKVITKRLDLECERKGHVKMASKFLALTTARIELQLSEMSNI